MKCKKFFAFVFMGSIIAALCLGIIVMPKKGARTQEESRPALEEPEVHVDVDAINRWVDHVFVDWTTVPQTSAAEPEEVHGRDVLALTLDHDYRRSCKLHLEIVERHCTQLVALRDSEAKPSSMYVQFATYAEQIRTAERALCEAIGRDIRTLLDESEPFSRFRFRTEIPEQQEWNVGEPLARVAAVVDADRENLRAHVRAYMMERNHGLGDD